MFATYNNQNGSGTEVSSQESCLLCGRTKYCFHIKNEQGEIYKILCKWTNLHDVPEGWQHVSTTGDRLIFVKLGYQRKRRSKKYPEVIELKLQPKTDIPQWQDVYIPVEQAERGYAVKIKPEVGLGSPETVYEIREIKAGKRQGNQISLVVLTVKGSPYDTTIEVAHQDLSEVVTSDPLTGAKEQFIEYFYSKDLKEVRHQWTDRRKVYNGESKKVRPHRRLPDNTWVSGKGEIKPSLYQQLEAEIAIRSGGIVFAVGGPQVVEWMRQIGFNAVCNQGGEGRYRQIAEDLAPAFAEAIENELKPLLVSWGDNDDTGRKTFGEGLLKECYKHGITCVAINPLTVWSSMPPGGDAKDWIEHCQREGISPEDMRRQLEFAIDEAVDHQEEEVRLRWQREAWDAPVSHKGEIGRWIEKKHGQDTKKEWKPLCSFDFQVEREFEDARGGGLVLQVKRSIEQRQHRVILKSKDYTKVDKFVDALKTELGTGIVATLKNSELGALIHTRLHEYRTNRQGKLYKCIDRYGQQTDGTWVFRDRQYNKDGLPTSEEETGWVFNNVSSEGDEIPCPELAPENPLALKRLVSAARQFFGQENFYQVILMMGWVTSGLHSQVIFKEKRWFPLINAYGEPGSCKTLAAEAALSLVGSNWAEQGMLARASTSAIYEHGSRTGSLPFIWDDPPRDVQYEEIAKTWANRKARVVRENRQEPHSPMGLTSNHVFGGDQAATYTRLIRLPFERGKAGVNASFQELQVAQSLASGAFSSLLKIGYPIDVIASIERELLDHLPKAHARIAQALAIVVYYAQKVVELAEGTEDIKGWVIDHLCPSEDDADSAGDSLQDFIDKLLSLESESLVGDWNKQAVTTRNGQKYIALHYSDVWALVDKHHKPATYNLKALKPLVIKAGGRVDNCTQKFDVSRDETLAYYRARINPRVDAEGNEYPAAPPRKVGRKAWLLPISLFGDANDEKGDAPNPNLFYSQPNDEEFSQVTKSYQELPKLGNLSKQGVESDSVTVSSQVTKLPNIDGQIRNRTDELLVRDRNHVDESISESNPVTLVAQRETHLQDGSQEVTEDGNSVVTGNLEQSLASKQSQQAATPIKIPSENDLAVQILQCQTWVAVVEAIDAVATATGEQRQTVFRSILEHHISSREDRQPLVKLLAEHIRQFPHDQSAYSWLPKSCRKLKEKAFALAQDNTAGEESANE